MKKRFLHRNFLLTTLLASCLLFSYASDGQIITTFAGSGSSGYSGDGGAATAATVNATFGGVCDAAGNVYFSDAGNNVVRKISPAGIVSTIAGTGAHAYGGDGGPATAAKLAFPSGLAFDTLGNLYISDPNNYRVRKIDPSGIITTFAGTGTTGYSGDGDPATAAQIGYSDGVFVDPMGNVIIPDPPNNRIRKVNPSGIISTIVGTGTAGSSGDGGPATAAQIDNPLDVKVDRAGNLYFTEFNYHTVRKVTAAGIISTIAGTGTSGYGGDGGPATAAQLYNPVGIDVDGCGNIYIGDMSNHSVRMINTSGIISTIAGNGSGGFSGDGGAATAAGLNRPHGVWHDSHNNIYIADRNNWVIRKVSGVASGYAPHFVGGASQTLTICVNSAAMSINSLLSIIDSDAGQAETWSVNIPPAHGSLSGFSAVATSTGSTIIPAGLSYTPATGYAGQDTFTVAISDCQATAVIAVYVTVNSLPDASIVSGKDSICIGDTVTFHAAATGGNWHSSDTSVVKVSASGLVTGISTGTGNIYYVVSNTCGTDTGVLAVKVRTHASCSAGLGNLQSAVSSLQIYPNPSHGSFTINVSSLVNEVTYIAVTNILGEKIKDFIGSANKDSEIALTVPPGLYFVSVATNGERINAKIIVE